MPHFTRRAMLAASGAAALGACANTGPNSGAEVIDARVEATKQYLYATYPGTQRLRDASAGALFMPLMTKAGLGIGGAYGRGALQVNGATVAYYSAAAASFGLQIGAQQYAHALFFMTRDALTKFRLSQGWSVSGDLEYAVLAQGAAFSTDTLTTTSPIVAVIFGQAGLIAGASLEGTKYTRLML